MKRDAKEILLLVIICLSLAFMGYIAGKIDCECEKNITYVRD